MTFKLQYINPDITLVTTYLTSDINIGEDVLEVHDSSSFSDDDYLIIENVGCEILEVVQINSVVDTTHIELKQSIRYNHLEGVTITKISFNQMRLYYSSEEAGPYTLEDTQNIDYKTFNNKTDLSSIDGSYESYWKVGYYNETTTNEILSDAFQSSEYKSILTIQELRDDYSFGTDITDAKLYSAILWATEQSIRKLYTKRTITSGNIDTEFNVSSEDILEMAKLSPGTLLNEDDVKVYERDTNYKKTYLNTKIVRIDDIDQRIYFNEEVPSSDCQIVMEIYFTYFRPEEIEDTAKQLVKLYSAKYILTRTPVELLQTGVGGWTLNGVTIDINASTIKEVVDDLNNQIKEIIFDYSRFYIRSSRMTNERRIRNFSGRFGYIGRSVR